MMRPRLPGAVTSGVLLILLACGVEEQQFPTYSPTDGNPALLTSEDIAVYETVISGYAQAGQILMSAPPPGPPPAKPITDGEIERVTHEHAVRMRPYTSTVGDVAPLPDRWRTLDHGSVPRLVVPRSAVSDFRVRNVRRASLKAFRPRHLQIEWSDKMETLSCLYSLTLPGYSRSGDEAIVEITCGTWALAGGGEVLYLRRSGDAWRVVAKQPTWIS